MKRQCPATHTHTRTQHGVSDDESQEFFFIFVCVRQSDKWLFFLCFMFYVFLRFFSFRFPTDIWISFWLGFLLFPPLLFSHYSKNLRLAFLRHFLLGFRLWMTPPPVQGGEDGMERFSRLGFDRDDLCWSEWRGRRRGKEGGKGARKEDGKMDDCNGWRSYFKPFFLGITCPLATFLYSCLFPFFSGSSSSSPAPFFSFSIENNIEVL